jgi:hypothetical protein
MLQAFASSELNHKSNFSRLKSLIILSFIKHANKTTMAENTAPRKKHDTLLKAAFEELFPYLLRFCFADADDIFNFRKKPVFLDKELAELFPEPEKQGGNRFVDLLAKVFLKNGKEEWILVHIEIQGRNAKDFPLRMFQYWYRIYDRYAVDITALVIFTGNQNQKVAGTFHKAFMGTEIIYRYNAYHIFDHTEEELLAMNNPFALIVLAAQKALLQGKVPEEELGKHRLTVAKALIQSKKFNHKKIQELMLFLKSFIYVGNREINIKFDEQIYQLTGKKITMGIMETIKQIEREEVFEKGIEKGIEKKSREFIQNLLTTGKFSVSEIAGFAGVTEPFVRKVRASLKKKK